MNPDTVRILASIRQHNLERENAAKIVKADLNRRRDEYLAEAKRLKGICDAVGMTDQALAGPASAYLEVLTECCAVLGLDSLSGLEQSLTDHLVQQAEQEASLATSKRQVEEVKGSTVEMLRQLERLTAAVEHAKKEASQDAATNKAVRVELDFVRAKEKKYCDSLAKGEALFARDGGGDPTLRHSHVASLSGELSALKGKVQSAQSEIAGFQKLPPSCDLARVEVSKAEAELTVLTEAVNTKLSSINF